MEIKDFEKYMEELLDITLKKRAAELKEEHKKHVSNEVKNMLNDAEEEMRSYLNSLTKH